MRAEAQGLGAVETYDPFSNYFSFHINSEKCIHFTKPYETDERSG